MMLFGVINLTDVALILAGLAVAAFLDGIYCASNLNKVEGAMEALFAGGLFGAAAKSINDGGVVYAWLDQSDVVGWALVALVATLLVAIATHLIRTANRTVVSDDATSADDTEE